MSHVSLSYGAEHLLRRFSRRKIVRHIRISGLDKSHPSRAARSEHRPLIIISVSKSLKKFTALFHYSQVSRIVCVENVIYTDLLKGTDKFTYRAFLIRKAYLFSPGSPHRRGDLRYDYFIGIAQSVVEKVSVISLPQSAYGAMSYTLAAENAAGILKR